MRFIGTCFRAVEGSSAVLYIAYIPDGRHAGARRGMIAVSFHSHALGNGLMPALLADEVGNSLRLHHTSITVKSMNESIEFYVEKLGLKLVSRREIPENNAEIAFISDGQSGHQLELTWWRDKKEYVEGDQLDHIALAVDDVGRTVEELRVKGVRVAKEPYTLSGGSSRIAFALDVNGIWLELIERR